MRLGGVLCICLLLPAALYADHAVDINTADKATLDSLPGIGEVKAQAIIDYRAQNGPFATKADIQNVSGIGPATYEDIEPHIVVSGPPPQTQTPAPASTTQSAQTAPTPQSSQGSRSYVAPPEPVLFADAGADRTVIVGADAVFRGRAYNRDGEIVEGARFSWNFGDGTTAEGRSVSHHFTYPGRYLVALSISESEAAASDRVVVHAVPAQITLRAHSDGSLEVRNGASFDIDIAHWIVREGTALFSLPAETIVLSGESVRIAPKTLGFSASGKGELLYPNGEVAARADTVAPAHVAAAPAPVPVDASAPDLVGARAAEEEDAEAPEQDVPAREDVSHKVAAAAAASDGALWWASALGLAALVAGTIVVTRRTKSEEWDIEEVR